MGLNHRKIAETLNYDGVTFPIHSRDYGKIERQNDIAINVFGYEEGRIYPIYVSRERFEKRMDPLLITEEEGDFNDHYNDEDPSDKPPLEKKSGLVAKSHYVYINDFDRMMFKFSKNKYKKHFCRYCLQCFSKAKCFSTSIVLYVWL